MHPPSSNTISPGSITLEEKSKKRKRGAALDNEIDALFDASLGKRIKRGALDTEDAPTAHKASNILSIAKRDKGLSDVLGAIRAAPKGDGDGHSKKKRA